jgi:hypothetical protein
MRSLLLLPLLLIAAPALAAQGHDHAAMMAGAAPAACAQTTLACADKATPLFVGNELWLAWSAHGRVAVQKSGDLGRTFGPVTFVNRAVERLDAGADSRPQIAVDAKGRAVAAYTIAKGADFAGQVMVAHGSAVGFDVPKPLTDSTVSQRFVSFALDPEGAIFAAWIDKRNLDAAKKSGKAYDGAALAYAWSEEGKDFAVARIAQDNTCECCRIGVAFAGPRKPVVMWRNMFAGGVRDHAIMSFDDRKPGPVHRVAVDDWKIDACPHQGPSLAVGANGTYHATWFTDGRARQGLFYAASRDGGQSFSQPIAVGNPDRQPTRPFVQASGDRIWLVWKEFDGEESVVNVMQSRDDGLTWSKATPVAKTTDSSDHPLLVANGGRVYLSWLTHKEGYRLIALGDTP